MCSLGAGAGTSGCCQGDAAWSWSVGGVRFLPPGCRGPCVPLPGEVWEGAGTARCDGVFMDTYILLPAMPGWGEGSLRAGQQAVG